MKRIFLALLAAGFAFTAQSCSIAEARQNRAKIRNVRVGMTRAEVKAVMGNPVDEAFSTGPVWYYYTETQWYDGVVTRDECTPFVFDPDEDRLLGFGYDFYKKTYSLTDWNQKAINRSGKF